MTSPAAPPERFKILFVCLGNICRSPTAEGVFRRAVEIAGVDDQFAADSAGTGAWHLGQPPDRRARRAAAKRGIDLSDLRGRTVSPEDFQRFDLILAMDRDNLAQLQRADAARQTTDRRADVALMMDYAPDLGVREVPDPYFGGVDGFERVLDLLEAAVAGVIDRHRSDRPRSERGSG